MLLVLCGTNRPDANTRKVAQRAMHHAQEAWGFQGKSDPNLKPLFLDLGKLKEEIFSTKSYGEKPGWFLSEFQQPILDASGIIVVTPEYNGSFPGVLKYFIDMLKFPESLVGVPVCFIGVAAGQFGALRSIEQLAMIFTYRNANIFGEKVYLPGVNSIIQTDGSLGQSEERVQKLVSNFVSFCSKLQMKG